MKGNRPQGDPGVAPWEPALALMKGNGHQGETPWGSPLGEPAPAFTKGNGPQRETLGELPGRARSGFYEGKRTPGVDPWRRETDARGRHLGEPAPIFMKGNGPQGKTPGKPSPASMKGNGHQGETPGGAGSSFYKGKRTPGETPGGARSGFYEGKRTIWGSPLQFL